MESGESIPKEETKPEDVPLPEDDGEIGLNEDDPLESSSYNDDRWNNFLKQLETSNKKNDQIITNLSQDLPSINRIRNSTIEKLKEIKKDVYNKLYEKYLPDDLERQKLVLNEDSYKPFDSPHEDVKNFLELSKNISQLEKGEYTETNKMLMLVLGEEETTPTKSILKKILDFLKKGKYPFLFLVLAGTLIGLFVDVEEQLNKAQNAIKHQLVKQLVKHLKNELQTQLLKTSNDILEALKYYLLHIAAILILLFIFYKS